MKYPRTYHFPFTGSKTKDDRTQYDYSNLIGVPIVITEKLDGSNCAITKEGVYARSHSTFSKNEWDGYIRMIQNQIGKDLDDDVYLFGENLEGIHSITYHKLKSYFYLFSVREDDIFLSWDDVEEYSYLLNLQLVPVLYEGIVKSEKELEELINKLIKGGSRLGGDDIEGVVVRVRNEFNQKDFSNNVCKWVRYNHVQTDQHWTKNWKRSKLI